MGHGGMLYSLPSRELIADAVEYMVNAHCADALVCISNCDKITPGMLLAALRLNIPTVFVSGGPMEAGKTVADRGRSCTRKIDLIDAMIASSNDAVTDDQLGEIERSACPTCGSCSGMFTANSMNCLTEAIGLALPGNGSTLATHAARRALFVEAGRTVVELAKRYYDGDDASVLPRADRHPGTRSRTPSPSTSRWAARPTRCCTCSPPPARRSWTSTSPTSTPSPAGCPAWPRSRRTRRKYHMEDVHRAGGIPAILGELDRAGLLHRDVHAVHSPTLDAVAGRLGHPQRHGHAGGDRALPRRARRGAHHRAVLHQPTAGRPWTPTPPTAASATWRTPTPPTAGWPSCTATSPRTAAWSRPPACPTTA